MQDHPDFITHDNVTSGCLLVLLCRTSSAGKRHPVIASVSQGLNVRTKVPCPCAAKGGTWGSHIDLADLHIFKAPDRP